MRPHGRLYYAGDGRQCPKEHPGQEPHELLAPLAPKQAPEPVHVEIVAPPFHPPPVVVEQAWYEKRWVQASGVTGVGSGRLTTRSSQRSWNTIPMFLKNVVSSSQGSLPRSERSSRRRTRRISPFSRAG